MEAFGKLLRTLRRRTLDPLTEKFLSQERFVEELEALSGLSYTPVAFSYWERGKKSIHHRDRLLLVGVLQVLHRFGALTDVESADELLHAGDYRRLNMEEMQMVNAKWQPSVVASAQTLELATWQMHTIPMQPDSYQSRQEHIDALMRCLDDRHAASITVIVGVAGIGKSTLAAKLATRALEGKRFERVFWIEVDMAGEDLAPELLYVTFLKDLAQQLLPIEVDLHMSPRQLIASLRAVLHSADLIVVDGLETREETEYFCRKLDELTNDVKLLVTTRHHPPTNADVQTYQLPELTEQQARDLLLDRAQRTRQWAFLSFTDAELDQIIHWVGGNPLFLRSVPSLMRFMPPKKALKLLQSHHIMQDSVAVLEDVWEGLSLRAKQLLGVFSFMGQEVSEELLGRVTQLNDEHIWQALDELSQAALLEIASAQRGWYRVHRVTARYVLHTQHDDTLLLAISQRLLEYWQQRFDSVQSSAWHIFDAYRHNMLHSVLAILHLPNYASLVGRLLQLMQTLYEYTEMRGYEEALLPLWKQWLHNYPPSDDGLKINLLNQMGNLQRAAFKFEDAVETHKKALTLAESADDTLQIARTHVNISKAQRTLRAFGKAASHAQAALLRYQLIDDERGMGESLNALGLIAMERGDIDYAIDALRRASDYLLQSDEPRSAAFTLTNLANALQHAQRFNEAFNYYERARVLFEEYGQEQDPILIAISEGSMYATQGDWERAEQIFRSVDLTKVNQRRLRGQLLFNLGSLALVRENYTRAEQLLIACLPLWQEIGDPWLLARTYYRLAHVYTLDQRYDDAREQLIAAASVCERYPADAMMIDLMADIGEHQTQLIYYTTHGPFAPR